jgi:hypothetical protein
MSEVDAMILIVTADGRVNLVALDVRGSHAGPSRVPGQAHVKRAPICDSTGREGGRL